MSDAIKHECGIALLRLLKPLDFYLEKYGTPFYGINKLYLLMEKQHNRGQDGAGVANIKLDVEPGNRYISRTRSNSNRPLQDVFDTINGRFIKLKEEQPDKLKDPQWLKDNMSFTGELFLGHLRYGTYGKNSIAHCHPLVRQNNWMTRNLAMAGNFNLTNVDELFNLLVSLGQHPMEKSDTVTVIEKIGHFLDEENEVLYQQFKEEGHTKQEISHLIADNLDIPRILTRSVSDWDGGYAMAGMIGHGDAFVLRDPHGIRPAFYYTDDEIAVVTSERPVIQTVFNVSADDIQEVPRGEVLVIRKNGEISHTRVSDEKENKACSFERIYFSRGSDKDIYRERIALGKSVCPVIFDAIDHDLKNTVFSFIPNTAEVAFYGVMKGVDDYLDGVKKDKILKLGDSPDEEKLMEILSIRPRAEKIAIKDAKLRTFITRDDSRDELVKHVYDITYETVRRGEDNLVIIDDSIVRGTTLKQSIIGILDRLGPKKIVVVSSAPQIRYPDCYGIDMARLGDFVAFQAAIELHKDRGTDSIIQELYQEALEMMDKPADKVTNVVKKIYDPFTDKEISRKIGEILTSDEINAEVEIIYQSIEGLHQAVPDHPGDWYFTGDFPTPGGRRVVNKAFIYYVEGRTERAY